MKRRAWIVMKPCDWLTDLKEESLKGEAGVPLGEGGVTQSLSGA